jgi:hypothetical protein
MQLCPYIAHFIMCPHKNQFPFLPYSMAKKWLSEFAELTSSWKSEVFFHANHASHFRKEHFT